MSTVDLVDAVADRANITKAAARDAVNAVFDQISTDLQDGQEIKLGGVGRLYVKVNKARTMNGFGKPMKVPEQRVVRFKQFPSMKTALNPAKKAKR